MEQGISNMSVCVNVSVVETSEPHCVDTQKRGNQQEMHETTTDDYLKYPTAILKSSMLL